MGTTTTTYVIDPASALTTVLSETTGTATTRYLYGLDLLAQNDGANTRYFEYDGLGSVRQLTDSTGGVNLAQTFDPYGNGYSSAGTAATNYGYTGEQTDSDKLLYLRARYYNPQSGQFFQTDPSGFERNLYQYAGSNPVRYADPTGYDHWWCEQTNCVNDSRSPGYVPFLSWTDIWAHNVAQGARQAHMDPLTYLAGVHFWQGTGNVIQSRPAQTCMQAAPTIYSPTASFEQHFVASRACTMDVLVPVMAYLDPVVAAPGLFPVTTADVMMTSSADDIVRLAQWQEAQEQAAQIVAEQRAVADVGGVGDLAMLAKLRGGPDELGIAGEFDTENLQAISLLEEAAKASQTQLGKYVDIVAYDPLAESPYYDVSLLGERRIFINPGTLEKTKAGQLIAASHELAHAQKFEFIRQRMFAGDVLAARDYFFRFEYFQLYGARDEVIAETLALNRVQRYLGYLSPQQVGHSTRYINSWLEGITYPHLP